MRIYVRYQDDGPGGVCGQTMDITTPWDTLHVFDDEDSAQAFIRKVNGSRFRKNQRISGLWSDDEILSGYGEVVTHYAQ